jgi:DNA-binding SARP family transcriptional activator
VELPELSKRLLVFLALRDRPQRRSFIAGSLWPEKPEARATANLRSALWRMPTLHPEPIVRSGAKELALSPLVEVDVHEAEDVGWGLVQRGELPDALDTHLFYSDLLPGWYDEWLIVERERFAALQLHFLEAMATLLLEKRRVAEALDVALRLVAADPLREGSQRVLITVYLADGNWRDALGQLDRCRALLAETFGCEPSRELCDLVIEAVPSSRVC